MAHTLVGITDTIASTVVGALLLRAVISGEVGRAIAFASIAFAVRLVASLGTACNGAVRSRESLFAMALLGPLITHSVSRTFVGADVHLGLALNSSKASSAQAVAIVTLSSIGCAVRAACFILARASFPPNLAQAGGIITTISILAVWADGLSAINASIADITLALASHSVASSVARASIGAHLLLACLAHEARCTVACSINTAAM